MRYFRVECGNGICGCDEEWLTITNGCELKPWIVREAYTYAEGYAGQENDITDYDSEEEYWEQYEETIYENMHWEEISEELFHNLVDEEGWEGR